MTTNAAIHIEAEPARRRLILALGRGKSGKTIWARWLTEVMRARGVNPVTLPSIRKQRLRNSGFSDVVDPCYSFSLVLTPSCSIGRLHSCCRA